MINVICVTILKKLNFKLISLFSYYRKISHILYSI